MNECVCLWLWPGQGQGGRRRGWGFGQGRDQSQTRARNPVTIHCEGKTEYTVPQELHIAEKPDGNDGPHGITHTITTEGEIQTEARDRYYQERQREPPRDPKAWAHGSALMLTSQRPSGTSVLCNALCGPCQLWLKAWLKAWQNWK